MTDLCAHSKANVPNAWAKGSTNPVTQRPVGAANINGVTNTQNKTAPAQKGPSAPPKESNASDRHANDRLTFLIAAMMVSCKLSTWVTCVTSTSLRRSSVCAHLTNIFLFCLGSPCQPDSSQWREIHRFVIRDDLGAVRSTVSAQDGQEGFWSE
jgi:hypothetical protein